MDIKMHDLGAWHPAFASPIVLAHEAMIRHLERRLEELDHPKHKTEDQPCNKDHPPYIDSADRARARRSRPRS